MAPCDSLGPEDMGSLTGDMKAPVVKPSFRLQLQSYSPLNNTIQPRMKVCQNHSTEMWDKDASSQVLRVR